MKRGILKMYDVETQTSAPQYELRSRNWGVGDDELEIWQLPSPATPHIKSAVRVAGLRGRNLELVHHRVLRRLSNAGVKLRPMRASGLSLDDPSSYAVTEHLALMLGLLFRTLAPMRKRESMVRVAEGIEAMGQEEAAYWLGMAMHRVNPRRVLSALRMLLTDPSRRTDGVR
jgi:hypothetical protein